MWNGSTSNLVSHYTNKEVAFRYHGCDLSFFLSHALFSSFDIDSGSKLLLKLIAKGDIARGKKHLVDIGCGTGVLGVSLKKRHPEIEAQLQDRDALAALFARAAAERNGLLEGIDIRGNLAFEPQGTGDQKESTPFDLVVSNWPAKAGAPVLEHFFALARSRSGSNAHLAMVVVKPLKEQALSGAEKAGWQVRLQETTANHCAFIAEAGEELRKVDFSLAPYYRTRFNGNGYSLKTAYGLPDFDALPFYLGLFEKEIPRLLGKLKRSEGTSLIRNPGQGHIPLMLSSALNKGLPLPLPFRLASRDRLQLLVSSENLQAAGVPLEPIEHSPSPLSPRLENQRKASLAVLDLETVPGTDNAEDAWIWAEEQILPDGLFAVLGKSSDLNRIADGRKGFSLMVSKKHRGCRFLLFCRKS
jgi:hypothetical protein